MRTNFTATLRPKIVSTSEPRPKKCDKHENCILHPLTTLIFSLSTELLPEIRGIKRQVRLLALCIPDEENATSSLGYLKIQNGGTPRRSRFHSSPFSISLLFTGYCRVPLAVYWSFHRFFFCFIKTAQKQNF